LLILNAGNDGTVLFNSKVKFNDNLGIKSIDNFNNLLFAHGSALTEAKEISIQLFKIIIIYNYFIY
jgi:hypothetical protein